LILAALLGAAGGCGSGAPVLRSEDRFLLRTKETHPTSRKYRVACLPILPPGKKDPGAGAWPLEGVSPKLREEMIECLKVAGVFTEIFPVDESADGAYDLELELRLTQADVRYDGKNANFLLSLPLLALLSPLASAFIAADDFLGTLKFELVVRETSEKKVLCRRSFHVRHRISLDAFQCGLGGAELVFTIPSLAGFREREVGARVAPHLFRAASIRICETLAREITIPELDVIIAIGVNQAGYGGQNYAEKDAERFCTLLESQPGRKHSRLLYLGKNAKTDSIFAQLATLEKLRKRGNVNIRDLFIYYAGCGTNRTVRENGKVLYRPCIYLHGKTRTGRTLVAVSLEALAEKMSAIPGCANRVLIVDAGFTEEEGRSKSGRWNRSIESFRLPRTSDKGPSVLLACSPDRSAYEDERLGHGVFTHFLMKSMEKASDSDKNGKISVKELSTTLPWSYNRFVQMRLKKRASHPVFIGSATLFRLEEEGKEPGTREGK
jgi:hypothetical protein